ncbi:MAG: septal ring lytic transglycosylase RlpA family protein [Spirochaetia bacterium]|nr:septal ring lytic transglycosylase RlpA family protein [Spirochaetia bacterium]
MKKTILLIILFLLITSILYSETGIASWYVSDTPGALTANGEVYDETTYNAAHKTLPFGTIVEVKNIDNNKVTRVRINDRGPFVEGRIIDLTPYSAKEIDMYIKGIQEVELTIISTPEVPETKYLRLGETEWYTIQLGAFSNRQKVYDNYLKLWALGYYPHVELTQSSLLRLSIRWVEERQKEYTLGILKELGFISPLIKASLPPQ